MKCFIFAIVLLFESCTADKPIVIRQFEDLSEVYKDSSLGKEFFVFDDFFLVSNYQDKKDIALKIDSFVIDRVRTKSYPVNTTQVRFTFYKESPKTNIEAIGRNKRDLLRYSNDHDLVYSYTLDVKGTYARTKYQDGKLVDDNNKPIPLPRFTIKPIKITH
ncbi:MAG: hypothetical protein JWQ27_2408 [Ferruginibacter sp.]|nr:hypothetical protein [Ferruginibacter sp.]